MVARGWCSKHYSRWQRHGDPLGGARAVVHASDHDRFLAKVNQRAPGECWPWLARTHPDGYGVFYLHGKLEYAHRAAYELFVGSIPEGYEIDHVRADGCTRRDCVNWLAHLEPVPKYVNNMRSNSFAAKQSRQTHCIHGHEFTEENTYRHRGHRYCRTCRKARRRREAPDAVADRRNLAASEPPPDL